MSPTDPLHAFRQYLERSGPLPDASFTKLLTTVRIEHYAKNDYLLRHGEVSTMRYFVHTGLIVSAYLADNGKLYYKNFFTAGSPAGSIASALQGTPSRFSLLALEPSQVVAYEDAHYRALVDLDPAINRQYRHHLEHQWVIRNEQRHLAFATQTARERYRTRGWGW